MGGSSILSGNGIDGVMRSNLEEVALGLYIYRRDDSQEKQAGTFKRYNDQILGRW
jgi:hypothetical protein